MSLVGRKTPREENPLRSEVLHPREHVDDHVRVLGKVQSGNLPAPPSGRRSCTQPVPRSSGPESPRTHTLARETLERLFAVGGSRLIRALPPHGLRRLGRCPRAGSSGGSSTMRASSSGRQAAAGVQDSVPGTGGFSVSRPEFAGFSTSRGGTQKVGILVSYGDHDFFFWITPLRPADSLEPQVCRRYTPCLQVVVRHLILQQATSCNGPRSPNSTISS
jgi:hypothetical protein